MIEFDLDIPSLTRDGIMVDENAFRKVKKLHSSRMIK